MMNAKGLVRGMKNGKQTRGAKWISDAKGKYSLDSAGSVGHEYKVTIKVKKGTTQWLKDNGISFDIAGKEKDFMNKVLIKSSEEGAYGVGADLLDKFNRRVTEVSYKRYKK